MNTLLDLVRTPARLEHEACQSARAIREREAARKHNEKCTTEGVRGVQFALQKIAPASRPPSMRQHDFYTVVA
jgi:hypothetical protein